MSLLAGISCLPSSVGHYGGFCWASARVVGDWHPLARMGSGSIKAGRQVGASQLRQTGAQAGFYIFSSLALLLEAAKLPPCLHTLPIHQPARASRKRDVGRTNTIPTRPSAHAWQQSQGPRLLHLPSLLRLRFLLHEIRGGPTFALTVCSAGGNEALRALLALPACSAGYAPPPR